MSIVELMNLRTEFEELIESFSKSCGNGSSINTLEWFVNNGFKSNRLRNGYERAMEIAKIIIAENENVRADQGTNSSYAEDY